MENKIQIVTEFYTNELKVILKEVEDYLRLKSDYLPLDSIFKIVIGAETEKRIMDQKRLILKLASQLDGTEDQLNKIVEENLKAFLKLDTNYLYFRKRHKNFEEGKEILKETFIHKLFSDSILLKGTGETYEELTLSAFPNREAAEKLTKKEAKIYDKMINFLRTNRGIVGVPGIIRADVIDTSIKLYELVIEHLKQNIEKIYGSS